jgi:signal recognition particle subunit SEC65
MSSNPTGPYKSRLFNFLNRQTINLSDRLSTTIRNLKVAAEWGLQVVIYPIYLAIQTSRLVGRQIEQKAKERDLLSSSDRNRSNLENISTDEPIEGLFQAVEPLLASTVSPAPLKSETPLKITAQTLGIRGIASVVENRQLVLIDRHNQIIDILEDPHQQKIERWIARELAIYYRQKRALEFLEHQKSGHLPLVKIDSPNVLLPVRLLWQAIGWMQTSEIATSLDLFGESALVPSKQPLPPPPTLPKIALSQLDPLGVLAVLDDKVAEFEETELIEASPQALIQVLFKQISVDSQGEIVPERENLPDPFQIQVLIQAAIAYFFGSKSPNLTIKNTQTITYETLTEKNEIPQKLLQEGTTSEDPWLSWEDIFDRDRPNIQIKETTEGDEIVTSQLLKDSPLPTMGNSIFRQLKRYLKKTSNSQSKRIVKAKKNSAAISPSKDRTVKPSLTPSPLEEDTSKKEARSIVRREKAIENKQIELKEEWIETEATHVGYEKHILERILEILDEIVSWIEEAIVKIWKWFVSR